MSIYKEEKLCIYDENEIDQSNARIQKSKTIARSSSKLRLEHSKMTRKNMTSWRKQLITLHKWCGIRKYYLIDKIFKKIKKLIFMQEKVSVMGFSVRMEVFVTRDNCFDRELGRAS